MTTSPIPANRMMRNLSRVILMVAKRRGIVILMVAKQPEDLVLGPSSHKPAAFRRGSSGRLATWFERECGSDQGI